VTLTGASSGLYVYNPPFTGAGGQQIIDTYGTFILAVNTGGLQNGAGNQVIDNNGTIFITSASSGIFAHNGQVIDNNGTVTLISTSWGLQNQSTQQVIDNNGTVTLTNTSSGLYDQNGNQVIDNNGNISSPGNITAVGDITAHYSDERLKTKTGTLTDALDKVCSLDTFTYVPNDLAKSLGLTDGVQRVGVSAQQVQQVLPEAVKPAPFDTLKKSGENYLTVQYEKLVPLLIEAIKELNEKIKILEQK
jgi:hypothetical protein